MSLLDVKDLRVSFPTADGLVQAVRGVSFEIDRGKTLGIVGESGSGKSVTVQTVMGLTAGARVGGQVWFDGDNLLDMSAKALRRIRGEQISMIFQDPLSSLHPHYRIGWQIVEMIRLHRKLRHREARLRAVELLRTVGIPQPEKRVDDYPHQFSGGMRQRAMIAMALALNPKLLIADEPTTALDVTVQAQILELMKKLQDDFGTAIILITHDLGVVAGIADEVLVMYAGKVVERGDRHSIYYSMHHPYTRGLMQSIPARAQNRRRLEPIAGHPPSLIQIPAACSFHPRCPFVMDRCLAEEPPLRPVPDRPQHQSACWLPLDLLGVGAAVDGRRFAAADAARTPHTVQLAGSRRIS